VDKHIMMRAGARYFVVNEANGAVGLVTLADIRKVPRSDWPETAVSRVMVPLPKLSSTRPDAVLWSAFEKMGRDGVNQLPVVESNRIVGILSREDVLHYLRLLHEFYDKERHEQKWTHSARAGGNL
jgi:CBS domain-containing protein